MNCKIKDCKNIVLCKELCNKHYYFYYRRKKAGVPADWPYGEVFNKKEKEIKPCKVENCNENAKVKGYCKFHYGRYRQNVLLDRPKGLKGELNHRWNGGISMYPNHWTMQKNRLLKIQQLNGKCEICNHEGNKIHHKDRNKSNHKLDNLMLLCSKCHGRVHRGRKAKTSIWIRRYGYKARDLCKLLNCSYETLKKWHEEGHVRFFLGVPQNNTKK